MEEKELQQGKTNSYNKMKNEFYGKYRSEIEPTAKKYEKTRKKYLKITIAIYIIFWAIAGIFVSLYIPAVYQILIQNLYSNQIGVLQDIAMYIIGFCLVIPFFMQKYYTKEIEYDIKTKIMPTVCKCIGNLSWLERVCNNKDILAMASIIPADYTDVEIDDTFRGTYRDVPLEIVEAHYTKTTGNRKNRQTTTYFKGVYVVLEMNKKFKGRTLIKPDSLIKFNTSGLRRTELEDIVFEKKYDVYTNDEIEARYLITTSFMDRLNDMKTVFNTNNVTCSFYDKYLVIAFGVKRDLFNIISLTDTTTSHKKYFQMFEEFLSIVKLIDHFKLDKKIGL